MWFFKSMTDSSVFYCSGKTEFRVARTDTADLKLDNDASISRDHAVIRIENDKLTIEDTNSKYGTFINEGVYQKIKMEKGLPVEVKNGDVVRFGIQLNVWSVHYTSFSTCHTPMNQRELQSLESMVAKLGGKIFKQWDESCQYLTISDTSSTLLISHALTSCSHIVTFKFWSECLKAVEEGKTLPNPLDYVPKPNVPEFNENKELFLPNTKRKTLFSGKKIVFFSRRQCSLYKDILTRAGGEAVVLSEVKMTKSMLVSNNCIVVNFTIDSSSQNTQSLNQINSISTYIASKGKRVIDAKEIDLALIHSSIDKYCNPSYTTNDITLLESQGLNSQSDVEPVDSVDVKNVIIEETPSMSESLLSESSSKGFKRKVSDSSYDDSVNKKPCITDNREDVDCKSVIIDTSKEKIIQNAEPSTSKAVKRKINKENDSNKSISKKNKIDDNDDDLFDFVESKPANENEKKLSFLKVPKRKAEPALVDADDNPFNFIESQPNRSESQHSRITMTQSSNKTQQVNTPDISEPMSFKNRKGDFELKPAVWKACIKVKNEANISNVDDELGSPVIVVKKDLIKKQNSLLNVNDTTLGASQKNFKKFKKVLPLYLQMTIVSKSSMSILKENLDVKDVEVDEDEQLFSMMESLDRCTLKKNKRQR